MSIRLAAFYCSNGPSCRCRSLMIPPATNSPYLNPALVAVFKLRLLTAPGHLLRGGDLLGCHFCCNSISTLFRRISRIAVQCCRSEAKPHVRTDKVQWHACAIGIHRTEIYLGNLVSLGCGEAIPL